jgi:signal transduction histidine kinase
VAGAVEVYKMPQRAFASIRKGQLTVVGTVLACGVLLYLSLFWIVRGAARSIDEQHNTLETRGAELVSANQELRAVQGQLLEAERMAAIGEVVTAVAHGIRNPLANIRASAQVASLDFQDGRASSPASMNLANIMAEVDGLEGRLKELLQFVRPAERPMGPLDLNAVLKGSQELMAGRIAKANLKLDTRLAPGLPPVLGNAMLLEQVFLSLIGNAIEAIPGDPGTITLITGWLPGNAGPPPVFAEVRDTGIGISAEEIPKIFEPFHTSKAQGTGLGLAIARKFTEAQGGSIRC